VSSSGSGTGTPAVAGNLPTTVATPNSAPFVLERVSGPEIEPVDLQSMKTHLRAFSSVTALDADITRLIQGAREWVEDFTGRALIDQKWRITINSAHFGGAWPSGSDSNTVTPINPNYSAIGWQWWKRRREILLRKSPVLWITKIVTVDSVGVETAIDPATWVLCEPDSKWPRIALLSGATWTGNTLKVEFRAGFADRTVSPAEGAEVVPYRFIQAMKLWAEANYNRDEKTMQLLLDTAERIIKPERAELGMA
jgi:hypothetical protein